MKAINLKLTECEVSAIATSLYLSFSDERQHLEVRKNFGILFLGMASKVDDFKVTSLEVKAELKKIEKKIAYFDKRGITEKELLN